MTDDQWEQISYLFPVPKTRRPPKDNRLMFNAILWITRSGVAWRGLPESYDSWKTVYSWFCKWRGDGILPALFHALNADYENLSIDSTIIKPHQHGAGVKKGL